MEELPVELNVLTLNCWGLKYISSYREERMTAIGRYLATNGPAPHIVALQECFTERDYRIIRRETRFALPYGKFYHSGAFGSGLVILSRWPIEESSMVPFSLCGRPTAFFRGDWYVGKGVAFARIRFGEGEKDIVEVFNTHTHPSYSDERCYIVHQLSEAWEIAKLVRGAAERGHFAIALGDFNCVPYSLPYRLLTAHAPIRDAWRVLNPESSLGSTYDELERARGAPMPTAAFNVAENGVTNNSVYNTWAWSRSKRRALRMGKRPMLVPPETPDERGHRIDYVFFSRGGDPHALPTDLSEILSARNTYTDDGAGNIPAPPGWVVKDANVGLMARHPELGCSLSDHFSVEATLVLHTPMPLPRRHRQRSESPSPTRGMDLPMSPIKSSTTTQSQDRGTTLRDLQAQQKQREPQRERPETPRSFTSTEAGLQTIGARAAALEQGAYLQSPAASSYRRNSRDQALWDQQLTSLDASAPPRLPLAFYDEIAQLIQEDIHTAQRYRGLRIMHFFVWPVVLIGSYIGIWFLPNGKGAFGLLVASSLGFAFGVVDLFLALLFHASEIRKLCEFEWEILNAKAVASGMSPDGLAHQASGEEKW
ncbi:DNase I-like protein [Xylariaceae sp. FL0255]|nr:DNase I-like protein [Xylariaceae sp. FL0255]